MSTLKERLTGELKDAMRAKDSLRLRTIRSLRAAIQEKEIELRRQDDGLDAEQELAVVQKQAKQRRDAMEQFVAAGRDDLAENERAELALIEAYLPAQLSDDEIEAAVRSAVQRLGASGMQDMGKVMGPVMKELQGRADGRRVQAAVRAVLQSVAK